MMRILTGAMFILAIVGGTQVNAALKEERCWGDSLSARTIPSMADGAGPFIRFAEVIQSGPSSGSAISQPDSGAQGKVRQRSDSNTGDNYVLLTTGDLSGTFDATSAIGSYGFAQQVVSGWTDHGLTVTVLNHTTAGKDTLVAFAIVMVAVVAVTNDAGSIATATVLQRIVLNHMQTVALLLNFDLNWATEPLEFFKFAESFSSIGEGLIQTDCLLAMTWKKDLPISPFYSGQIVYFLLPFCLIVPGLLYVLISHRRGLKIVKAKPTSVQPTEVMEHRSTSQLASLFLSRIRKDHVSLPELFAVFDERNLGVISVEEFVYILKDMNLAFSQAEYDQLASYFARMGKVSLPRVLRFGKSMKDKSIVLITVICFMLYPTISRKIFQSFSCLGGLKDGAADSYLNHDLEVACTDIGHIMYIIIVALPALLIYIVGFPLTSVLCVRKDRNTARHWRVQQQKSLDHRSETPDATAYRFSILLQGYHDRCWYWESVVMLRKATLILIAAYFGNFGPELQFFFASFTLVLAMIAQIYVKPFREDILNQVEAVGLMTMFVSLYIGIFFFWRLLNEQALFVLGVLVIVINALFTTYAVAAVLRDYLHRTSLGRIICGTEEETSALLIPGAATQATTAFDAESIAQRKLKERRLSLTLEKEKAKEQQQLLDHVAQLEEQANEEEVFML
eukprot:g1263.t1